MAKFIPLVPFIALAQYAAAQAPVWGQCARLRPLCVEHWLIETFF